MAPTGAPWNSAGAVDIPHGWLHSRLGMRDENQHKIILTIQTPPCTEGNTDKDSPHPLSSLGTPWD